MSIHQDYSTQVEAELTETMLSLRNKVVNDLKRKFPDFKSAKIRINIDYDSYKIIRINGVALPFLMDINQANLTGVTAPEVKSALVEMDLKIDELGCILEVLSSKSFTPVLISSFKNLIAQATKSRIVVTI